MSLGRARVLCAASVALALAWPPDGSGRATAQDAEPSPRAIELHFFPTRRAQIALWIESADGSILETIALTKSVAYYGIGNRPGALQMNSGFRWPYGRREGVLPVWAHRRVAHGGSPFRRVIFQNRVSEGWASRTPGVEDSSVDPYFCLPWNQDASRRETLFEIDDVDAVTCASVFSSDKGRYITEADLGFGYAEPQEEPPGAGMMAALSLDSLYPPRRDVARCGGAAFCLDTADVDLYAADARAAMPDIDAVTMATPRGGSEQRPLFVVPEDWPDGEYVAWLEINVEGDYNGAFNDRTYPTPATPSDKWDSWAQTYGYPYRGQPSVVYRMPFVLGPTAEFGTAEPFGYGSLSGGGSDGGDIRSMDDRITNDPIGAPGSGVDRLLAGTRDYRLRVLVRDATLCRDNRAPSEIDGFEVSAHGDEKHSHEWARMRFVVPADDHAVHHYQVRVGTEPIVDEGTFMRALPANAASLESEELGIPTDGVAGDVVEIDFGGLTPSTRYYVGLRAVDWCGASSAIVTGEVTTTQIHFTTVSPCFVATAAYGTPMAREIGALRRFRDRQLMTNAPGRALVRAYYAVGPALARAIRADGAYRAAARAVLEPLVRTARWLE